LGADLSGAAGGFAAGGAPDILARLFGQWLSDRLGQPFVIENRTGAGGNIATEAVVLAPADGHTLLLTSMGNAVNASLFERLNYNFLRDVAPVAGISREPLGMEVHPSFPAKTVSEFITYAKANPGKVNYGSAGVGSSLHMAGELFKLMAGVELVHVPYRGSPPALTDLLGGQVQLMFCPLPPSVEYVRSGRLRALAVTTAMRSIRPRLSRRSLRIRQPLDVYRPPRLRRSSDRRLQCAELRRPG
jgi:tripartite-type tricarboxylate transporter receptor subunit TctC